MQESVLDRAIELLHERRRLVRAKLAQVYKKTKPFRMEPVEPKQFVRNMAQGDPMKEQYLLDLYEKGKQGRPLQ